MNLDLFTPIKLTKAINQSLPARRFLAKNFFKSQIDGTEQIAIDLEKGSRVVAPFSSSRNIDVDYIDGDSIETKMITPYQINIGIRTNAYDLYKRAPGESLMVADGTTRNGEFVAYQKVKRDSEKLVNCVRRAEELMCAEALFTGFVTIKDKNGKVVDSIDLGLEQSHNITLGSGSTWDSAGTNPLNDFFTWKNLIAKDSGLSATDVIMDENAYNAFIANESVRETLNIRNFVMGQIQPKASEDGATFIGTIEGLNIWVYSEWVKDPSTGVERGIIPSGKICMLSRDMRATIHYGLINDIEAGKFATEIYSRMFTAQNGSSTTLQVRSAPLAVVEQIDAVVVATVV